MNILVYGAGALGSYLAHVLTRGGNNVTMLARGGRFEELQNKGNVIRHYFQFRTTVDHVNVIRELQPDDVYDLIFVVMKCPDFQAVLPALAANRSRHIVLVGNNATPHDMLSELQSNSPVDKQVAFGFETIAGWRQGGRVVSIHGPKLQVIIGSLGEELAWRSVIDQAFANTPANVTYERNMEEWLKSHIALLLPFNSVIRAYDGQLNKVAKDKELLYRVVDAIDEGHQVLEQLGVTVTPARQAQLARKRRSLLFFMLKMVLTLPVGKKILSDQAVHASEMSALERVFLDWKRQANIPTPNLDLLIP